MRKPSFLTLVCIALGHLLHAQDNIGMGTGNYAGISGAWFNPASIVDSRYKFDMTILGVGSYYTNDLLLVKNGTLVRRLLGKEPYNGSFDAVKEDLLEPLDTVNGSVHGLAIKQIQFPLSFMATTGKRSAIGLNIRNRTGMSVLNMAPATARLLFAELQDSSLFNTPQVNDGLDYAFLNWMEVGFTYGRVLASGKHHFLKAAATGKLLAGNAGIHIAAEQLTVGFTDAGHLSMSSPAIQYARTSQADFDTYSRRNLFNGVEDYAFGWDLGAVYELRGKVSKRMFTDLDQVEKERADLNKYIVRVGVALLDVGKFTFNRRPLTQDHSADIHDWDISAINASDLDAFDEAYSQQVDYVTNGSSTFTFGLPTALSMNVDLHVFGGFYLNAATYRDASKLMPDVDARLHAQEWTAVTPRFESRFFGFYVPVSHLNNETHLGATVRIGPFYLGSTNLADLLANEKNTSADFHAGMRFSIGQGKPSIMKKKYQAFLKTQQGIGANRTRIDSLSREVYALKHVVEDRAGGATVVNNFFGNDSTAMAMLKDSTVTRAMTGGDNGENARLREQNEYLMNELARTSVEQRRDSLYIADLENAPPQDKDRLKAARTEAKTAEKQSDATEDMAKELESIDKRMKRQNRILSAGAATGVVAVATKDDKDKTTLPDSVLAINDSAVVIGTDTVRLVAAPGASVKVGPDVRMTAGGDTAMVTVYDTVRVTVKDTVRIQQAALPVPVTNGAAQAEMQQLMEPVYFASGSTDLGPQGRAKVESIAAWLKKNPAARINVTGCADASGSLSANEAVAMKRATSVRDGLVKAGIEASRITVDRKLAPAGATRSAKDRRAEVRFLP